MAVPTRRENRAADALAVFAGVVIVLAIVIWFLSH